MLTEFVKNYRESLICAKNSENDLRAELEKIRKRKNISAKREEEYLQQLKELNKKMNERVGKVRQGFLGVISNNILNRAKYKEYKQINDEIAEVTGKKNRLHKEEDELYFREEEINSMLEQLMNRDLDKKIELAKDEKTAVKLILENNDTVSISRKFMVEVVQKYPEYIKYCKAESVDPYLTFLNKMQEDMQNSKDNNTYEYQAAISELINEINVFKEQGKYKDNCISIKYAFEAIRESINRNKPNMPWYLESAEAVKKYIDINKSINKNFAIEMQKLYESEKNNLAVYQIPVQKREVGDSSKDIKAQITKEGIEEKVESPNHSEIQAPSAEKLLQIAHYNHCTLLDMLDFKNQSMYCILKIPYDGLKEGHAIKIWGADIIEKDGQKNTYHLLPENIYGFVDTSIDISERQIEKKNPDMPEKKYNYHVFDSRTRYGKLVYTEFERNEAR